MIRLLLMLLPLAAYADLLATGSASIYKVDPYEPLSVLADGCSLSMEGIGAQSDCHLAADYGRLSLYITASGSGCDGCDPIYGASTSGAVGFSDEITFLGSGEAAVVWYTDDNLLALAGDAYMERNLPDLITFGVPYPLAASIHASTAANGNWQSTIWWEWGVAGFDVYSLDGDLLPRPWIITASGELYGGHGEASGGPQPHVPEPSGVLLLGMAGAIWLALLWRKPATFWRPRNEHHGRSGNRSRFTGLR